MKVAVRLIGLATMSLGVFLAGLAWSARKVESGRGPTSRWTGPKRIVRESTELARGFEGGLLFLVLLGGGFLCAMRWSQPLTYDEVFTLLYFVDVHHPWRAFLEFRTLNNHPVFSFLVASLSALGIQPAVAGKGISFAAHLGAIFGLHWLGKELSGPKLGLLLAFIFTLLPFPAEFGSMVRGYSLLLCLTVFALVALVRAHHAGSRMAWILFSSLMWVSIGVHLFAVPLFLGLVLGSAVFGKDSAPRMAFRSAAVVTVGSFLLYLPILHNVFFEIASFTYGRQSVPGVEISFLDWIDGAGILLFSAQAPRALRLAGWVLVILCCLAGFRHLKRRVPTAVFGPLLLGLAFFLLPLVLLIPVSFSHARFFLPAVSLISLLVAAGVREVPGFISKSLCLAALCGLSLFAWGSMLTVNRPSLDRFAAQLETRLEPKDCLIADWHVADVLPFFFSVRVTPDYGQVESCVSRAAEEEGEVMYACLDCDSLSSVADLVGSSPRRLLTIPAVGNPQEFRLFSFPQVKDESR